MFRSILVPVDGSTHADRALAEASELAGPLGASLTVMTSVPDLTAWTAWAGTVSADVLQAAMDESAQKYREILDEAITRLPPDLEVTTVLARGRAGPAIVEQVEKGDHDLVVIGSRGRGDAASFVLGSVSHYVVHSGRVPVLIVHAAGPRSQADGDEA